MLAEVMQAEETTCIKCLCRMALGTLKLHPQDCSGVPFLLCPGNLFLSCICTARANILTAWSPCAQFCAPSLSNQLHLVSVSTEHYPMVGTLVTKQDTKFNSGPNLRGKFRNNGCSSTRVNDRTISVQKPNNQTWIFPTFSLILETRNPLEVLSVKIRCSYCVLSVL